MAIKGVLSPEMKTGVESAGDLEDCWINPGDGEDFEEHVVEERF